MRKLLSLILVMTMVLSLCCFGSAYAEEEKPETKEQAETVEAAPEEKTEEAPAPEAAKEADAEEEKTVDAADIEAGEKEDAEKIVRAVLAVETALKTANEDIIRAAYSALEREAFTVGLGDAYLIDVKDELYKYGVNV